jgi:hypothetical protein
LYNEFISAYDFSVLDFVEIKRRFSEAHADDTTGATVEYNDVVFLVIASKKDKNCAAKLLNRAFEK